MAGLVVKPEVCYRPEMSSLRVREAQEQQMVACDREMGSM